MPTVPYMRAPPMPQPPPAAGMGGAFMQGLQAMEMGMQLGDNIRARREQRKLQKLLAKRGRLEPNDFRTMAAINPMAAQAVFNMQNALDQYEVARRDDALSMFSKRLNFSADIAFRLTEVPEEQRATALEQILTPLMRNPQTKEMASDIVKGFLRDPDGDGPQQPVPDFSDARLTTMLGTATSLDTYLASQTAQRERAHELRVAAVEHGRLTPEMLSGFKELGYTEDEALAFVNPEHGVRMVPGEDGLTERPVGVSGRPLFSGGPDGLPPGGADQPLISPEDLATGVPGGQPSTAEPPAPTGGGWLDRMQRGLTPRTTVPNPETGVAAPAGPGAPSIDPVQQQQASPAEEQVRQHYQHLTPSQRTAVRSGAATISEDDAGNTYLEDGETGQRTAIMGPAKDFRDRLKRQGYKMSTKPASIEDISKRYIVPPGFEREIREGEWELWYGTTGSGTPRGRLVRKGGTQAIPLRVRRGKRGPGGTAPAPGNFPASN